MRGALRYEVLRIRTIASSYWLSGMAILLTAVITLLLALTVTASNLNEPGVTNTTVTNIVILGGGGLSVVPILAAAFMAVMGAMTMGHEYRYGTNKATLSALPDRVAVLAAKVIVLACWVAAVVAATLIIDMVIAALFLDSVELGSSSIRPVLGYLSYCEGFAIAGFALSAIFRNQTGAIVAVLVWPYVIEPIIFGILAILAQNSDRDLGTLTNLLPSSAGRRTMFDPYDVFSGFGGVVDTWSIGASFLVFWIGVVGLVAAGSALFIARDA